MKFIILSVLLSSSTFGNVEESFLADNSLVTEAEFLIERDKNVQKNKERHESYKKECSRLDNLKWEDTLAARKQQAKPQDFDLQIELKKMKCQRNLRLSHEGASPVYTRYYQAKAVLNEELNNRLGKCIVDRKGSPFYKCLKSELDYRKSYRECNLSPSKKSQCLLSAKKEFETIQNSTECKGQGYAFPGGFNVPGMVGTIYNSKNIKTNDEYNNTIDQFKYCARTAIYEKGSFAFNPDSNNFLSSSKKEHYLNLIKDYKSNEYNSKGYTHRQIHREGYNIKHIPNFAFANPLTGDESFLTMMYKDKCDFKGKSLPQRAIEQMGISLSYSAPCTWLKLTDHNSTELPARIQFNISLNPKGEFSSAGGVLKFHESMLLRSRLLPLLNSDGNFEWRDRDKGQIKWFYLGDSIYNELKKYFDVDNYVPDMQLYIRKSPDSNGILLTVRYFERTVYPSGKVLTSPVYKDGELVAEFKIVKEGSYNNHDKYEVVPGYEGPSTIDAEYQYFSNLGLIKVFKNELNAPDISANRKSWLEEQIKDRKARLEKLPATYDKSKSNLSPLLRDLINEDVSSSSTDVASSSEQTSNNDVVTVATPSSVANTSTSESVVTAASSKGVLEADTSTAAISGNVLNISEGQSAIIEESKIENKVDPNQSYIEKSVVSVAEGCHYTTSKGESVVDLHQVRLNSLNNMILKMAEIGCSQETGEGCHSAKARELIFQHHNVIKDTYARANNWKSEVGLINPSNCTKLYGIEK